MARVLLRVSPHFARVPGWFAFVTDPLHQRFGDLAQVEVDASPGRMLLDLRDYNQRRIYYGVHEQAETRLFRNLLRPGDVVLDVGANVGYFSLLAATLVAPDGHVHAFEPIPANTVSLRQNLSLNGIENVHVVEAAAGAETGTASFGIPTLVRSDIGQTSGNYTRGGSSRSIDARVIILDEYTAAHLPGRDIRLVKVDVEGVEPEVLAGLACTLRDSPPDVILIEVNRDRLRDHGYGLDEVADPLEHAGYALRRLTSSGRQRALDRRSDAARPIFNIVAARTHSG